MATSSNTNVNVHYKTGSLQQTQNYIWNTADTLGRGATAVVYFGREKTTGRICAIKSFHDRASYHLLRIQDREVETLRSLDHENVVKLLAIENEQTTGNKIIIMEYCSGGSVHNMLEQPQYGYGFPEVEFLLFLTHISSGLSYLRLRGYIHRDIKPGNIMRYIGENGTSVYKLSDFGSARELLDDQCFMSIYGTEEYLHPNMYQRAVLKEQLPTNKMFDSSVDFWSLGVTIYHVATGKLPFRPYEGRDDAHLMHIITSQKPVGAISGVQESKNGDIVWSKVLPDTCRLSHFMKESVTQILAGLMETNPMYRWREETYFSKVEELGGKIKLNVFYNGTGEDMCVYLNKMDTFCNLQDQLAKWTDVLAANLLILWQERRLTDFVQGSDQVQNYPQQILKGQLFLYKSQMDLQSPPQLLYPAIPAFQEVLSTVNVDQDAHIAKRNSALAYFICVLVSRVIKQQGQLGLSDTCFRSYLKSKVNQFQQRVPDLKRMVSETKFTLKVFSSSYGLLIKCLEKLLERNSVRPIMLPGNRFVEIRSKIETLKNFIADTSLHELLSKVENRLEEIEVYTKVLSEKIFEQERAAIIQCTGCLEDDHCISKGENLKDKVISIATIMLKHKKYRTLHHHEEFIHQTEKQKMQEYCAGILSIYQDHCLKNLQQTFRVTMRQFGIMSKHLLRTTKVDQNVHAVTDCHDQLTQKFKVMEANSRELVQDALALIDSIEREEAPRRSTSGLSQTQTGLASLSLTCRGALLSDEHKRQDSRSQLLKKLSSGLQSLHDENRELKSLVDSNSDMLKRILEDPVDISFEEVVREEVVHESIVCQESH